MPTSSPQGFTVWFTGLPSSGKSTLARQLEEELLARGRFVEVLDGDEVRLRLTKGLGFSKEDRDENIRRIGFVSKLLSRSGAIAITATISPYREIREELRSEIRNFVEVYVDCPVEKCIERDVKGLYKKALAGEIKNFTGISDPYEAPVSPDITIYSAEESEETSLAKIIDGLTKLGYLPPADTPALTPVRLPSYLVERLTAQLDATSSATPATYLTELLSRTLAEEAAAFSLTPEQKRRIEARLAELGYLEV